MKFVPATDEDKGYFLSLSELVYREIVARQIGSWKSDIENRKFEEKWKEHDFHKIVLKNKVVGGFWLQEFETYYQLREIQIHPSFQRQGIGTKVLGLLINRCNKKIKLRVLLTSPAVKLYQRLGFKITGETSVQYYMELNS